LISIKSVVVKSGLMGQAQLRRESRYEPISIQEMDDKRRSWSGADQVIE
jgi:hypothetical protein